MARSLMCLITLSIFYAILIQKTGALTCFGVNGLGYPDNVICPGSNACCGVNATCLPNRLCHNEGQSNANFVRGPCALFPYSTDSCAEICVYNETAADHGFLPRVTTCADGSLCCDIDPTCCDNEQGVFLDDTGQIVSSLPSSSSTTQPSSSSSSSSTSSSTTGPSSALATTTSGSSSASQTGSSAPTGSSPSLSLAHSTSSGLSSGAKVGLGVGLPLGIAVIGGIAVIIWLQQRRIKRVEEVMTAGSEGSKKMVRNPPAYAQSQQWGPPKELMDNLEPRALVELPGSN